jgi:branched-chain amino acid transport system permease protein
MREKEFHLKAGPFMFAQQIINGFVAGSAYALFALGFTLMFGVLGVINLTYGFYFSAGAYIALFATLKGAPLGLALPLAAIGAGLIAVVLDALLLSRLRKASAPELASLDFHGASVSPTQILIVGTVAALTLGLIILLRASRIGLAMRAMAENPDAAELMGIDTGAVMRRVSFISGALGGAAGVLIGLQYNAITPYMGEAMTLKGFAIIILGGLGDIGGALVAGLLIGLLEALTAGYVSSVYKDAVGFLALVLTLWVRPLGLFGRASAKRA